MTSTCATLLKFRLGDCVHLGGEGTLLPKRPALEAEMFIVNLKGCSRQVSGEVQAGSGKAELIFCLMP